MNYPSIRIEGAILSPDILEGIEGERGQGPADFNLDSSAKVKDEIARAWADAQDYWRIFQRKLETLKADSSGTSETRQLWMAPLLGLLGYQLEYQPKGAELNGKIYNISHRATNRAQAPVQIVGYREPAGLDRKPERSNLRMSAHAVVQEFLNLNEQLYGLVTNGRVLRLLRNSSRLIKLSYLEFDLDRMFADALFADFAVLYRLLHATRLPVTNDTASESLIESYHQRTIEQGTRIREGLREAVTEALEIFGTGFIAHPENSSLREKIEAGTLDHTTFFSHLLRLIYRILFLNVVEERGLIFPKGTPSTKLRAYFDYYSLQRLRRLARTRGLKTERHHDAWLSLLSTFQIFENPERASRLGTTAFGGQLFDSESLGPLGSSRLSNAAFLGALDRLCSFDDLKTKQRRPVNFGALATEEFGSVYESLLELHPVVEITPSPHFGFKQIAGNERKTSGSYYTPASLVDCLLDSALDPVLRERIRNYKTLDFSSVEEAILALKVCDPACGSGHFLIAAAQRIARRLALVRSRDEEPSPDLLRNSLRQVISHCIYAVDINPMAVELCRVALWLEAVEPGKPLSFLDHHIRVGNSLLGATPELIAAGLPDDAFKPIEGDDKEICSALKKRNKKEREGQQNMLHLMVAEPESEYNSITERTRGIDEAPDNTIVEVQQKAEQFHKLVVSPEYRHTHLVADSWCSAFVFKKGKNSAADPITTDTIRRLETDPKSLTRAQLEEVKCLSNQYQFFHWYLAFPEVFFKDGFDCILGNPPWEKLQTEELQFFAGHDTDIVLLAGAKRKAAIQKLLTSNPGLAKLWDERRRFDSGWITFVRNSGRFGLTGVGKFNTFALFAELSYQIISGHGRAGIIVPSGIATDDTTKHFFGALIKKHLLISLFDFENRNGIFPSVHRSYKFCLLTLTGKAMTDISPIQFTFFAQGVEDLQKMEKRFTLTPDDIRLINPNSFTCPIFRSSKDAELTKFVYRRIPVFLLEGKQNFNEYEPRVWRLLNTTDDSNEFISGNEVGNSPLMVPVVEAKTIHQFDHRYGTFVFHRDSAEVMILSDSDKEDAYKQVQARHYVTDGFFRQRLPSEFHQRRWFATIRNIARSTDERTCIATLFPRGASCEHTPYIEIQGGAPLTAFLIGIFNSFVFDYIVRQKVGGTHISYFILYQLPALPPRSSLMNCSWTNGRETIRDWILPRVLELTYTAWDIQSFANDCGWPRQPFRWNKERRFFIRCELDAAFFHLYLLANKGGEWKPARSTEGAIRDETTEDLAKLKRHFPTPRHAVSYILDTFPIVRRRDEEKFGEFRTKRVILEIYDAMGESIRTGQPYQTLLDPPPADPRCCHPARGGTLAPGSCRQLSDLMSDNLPQECFSFQTPPELSESLGTKPCQCRVLQPSDPLPPQDSWVIIRHPALLKAGTPCGIALGRFRYQEQINAQTGETFIHVVLRGGQIPAELNIPEAEWKDFRPLAVLHLE